MMKIGGERKAVFNRRKQHVAEGLEYTVLFSSDLGDWDESTDAPEVIASDAEVEAVAVPFPDAAGAEQACFFRVRITGN